MTYPENTTLAILVHALYFGMTVTFVMLTIAILVRASYHRGITKNKLTMRPYYYMIGYFSCIIAKNLVLLNLNEKGEFTSLFVAYVYLVLDYGKALSVLLSFGS
jgi:hypothetical protein